MAITRTRLAACTLAAMLTGAPVQALVGDSEADGPMARHALMVLARASGGAGFCSAVVIAPEVILTAAHCVTKIADTMVLTQRSPAPIILELRAIAIHPGYKAEAPRTRERSIDLALVRTATPLPDAFKPIPLGAQSPISVGALYGVSGFGVTKEGDGSSAGRLRWGKLRARAPLSSILLWAEDAAGAGFGACEGDSGGPVFNLETGALIAITSWSEGAGKQHCGALTQAALIAPQSAWIQGVLKKWGLPP